MRTILEITFRKIHCEGGLDGSCSGHARFRGLSQRRCAQGRRRAPRPAELLHERAGDLRQPAPGTPAGIASVYRALETLADLRLVKRIDAGDGIARYEPSRPDGDHHNHLVCRDCGKVEAFSDARLERAIDKVADGLGYSVEEHEVVLTGACGDCAA